MSGGPEPAPVVIIGMGSPMRRDDGVGPAALASIERSSRVSLIDVDLCVVDGEPTTLMGAWTDRRLAILVDAVRRGEPAGSIHRLTVGRDPLPPPSPGASTHAAGVGDAVALGHTLGRLPGELVIFGVEPGDLSPGEGLSPPVDAVLGELVDLVVAEATR